MTIHKAVIPAAGLGTRFLPATKATPKEMLPLVDKPAIQYVVEEAVAAGLDDVLMITGRGKRALEDHFDYNPELEASLHARGDTSHLAQVHQPTHLADVHFVRQGQPRGLGHAVLCAKHHVGAAAFAVLLGDDLIDERDPILPAMLALQEHTGGSVVALLEVEPEQIHLYGCASVEPFDHDGLAGVDAAPGDVVRVRGLVEKPTTAEAPSNLAVIGRYVLSPAVFGVLEKTPPGRGDEIQLTDALETLAQLPVEAGGGVYGIVFRGRRYDTGDRLGYLKAVVQIAADRADLGPDFRAWLIPYAAGLDA
jgi:UTP--glucose-1-phosphate uridylyltransferase